MRQIKAGLIGGQPNNDAHSADPAWGEASYRDRVEAAQLRETLADAPSAAVAPLALAAIVTLHLWNTPIGGTLLALFGVLTVFAGVAVVAARRSQDSGSLRPRAVRIGRVLATIGAGLVGSDWGLFAFLASGAGTADIRVEILLALAVVLADVCLLGPSALVSLAFTVPLVGAGVAVSFRQGDSLGLVFAGILLATFFLLMTALGRRERRSFDAILDRFRVEEQTATIETLLLDVEENADEWLWQTDAVLRLRHVSGRVASAAGLPVAALEGALLTATLRGSAVAPGETARPVLAALANHDPFRNQVIEIKTVQGSIWWRLTGRPVFDETGNFRGYRGLGADITASRDSEARIAYLANFDCWTGLANRALFQTHAARECHAAKVSGRGGALLYLDLDGFKSVNDSLGHAAGDAVLKKVAQRLTSHVPRDTLVARLGGDEFAIWTTTGVPAKAEALADSLIEAISAPYDLDGTVVEIGASIGIALAPRHGTNEDALLVRADLALYRAKADGKGRCRMFVEAYELSLIERRKLESDLKLAIARREFTLHYQPLVDLHDGQIVCFEALVRWASPSRGFVPPADFIPAAEGSGLIVAIGRWVLIQACKTAAGWSRDAHIAVNISPQHFRATDFLQDVRVALQMSGLHPTRLEIEVTEGVFLDASASAIDNLHALRRLGVRVALDDFGTGYSSLSYLIQFPVDKIKIDRSFIRDFVEREANRAVVDAILTLARKLSIRVTAEGVETTEQAQALKLRRCDDIQGYLLGRPRPDDEIETVLATMPLRFREAIPVHLETPLGFALAKRKQPG